MTSKSCIKSCSRKSNNNSSQGSIQFDKSFHDNSNRPSAAKSAGTVGKWGITSFTSIRNKNKDKNYKDFRESHEVKRLKRDQGNQSIPIDSTFIQNKHDDFFLDLNKPKKFFKSRNIISSTENSDSTIEICSQTRDSQATRKEESFENQIDDQYYSKKDQMSNCISADVESICRDEGKPPIVLRICKGTSKLISSENTEPESYELSNPPVLKRDSEQKCFLHETKFKKESCSLKQNKSAIIPSIDLPNTIKARNTRSRSKNFRCNNNLKTSSAIFYQNSGLSMTLRKCVDNSSSNCDSHYDIVKTDFIHQNNEVPEKISESEICSQETSVKKIIAPTTITSTQELIDILSNDTKSNNESIIAQNMSVIKKVELNREKTYFKNLTSDVGLINKNEFFNEISLSVDKVTNLEKQPNKYSSTDTRKLLESPSKIKDSLKSFDQDYLSSSDDSESCINNFQSEMQTQPQSDAYALETPNITETKVVNKPVLLKKGSIFKTRSTGTTNEIKRRALYRHKWCDNDKDSKSVDINYDQNKLSINPCVSINSNVMEFDEEFENSSLTRIVTYPENRNDAPDDDENIVTSVRCDKKVKGFYTVVKNVKKAHQIQESGEFQEFNDDVEYILDTLRDNNPNATRCLSAIRLASKCMAPAFRMHVRAHGTVAKFFKALHDATSDQSLALCTATVMFVLSQDRLAMDLDRDCLELMLSLLECDVGHKNSLDDCGLSYSELLKNKEKVRQLCTDIQLQGHAKHLNLDNITVGQLAMETLLSLTSKRAGEWFKEELRELGGLEHIIKTITDCHRHLSLPDGPERDWNNKLDVLQKVNRCLRVLENVTHMNEENQVYLLKYNEGVLVLILANIFNFCGSALLNYSSDDSIQKNSTGAVIRECLFAVVKVLINLTHRFNHQSFGALTVGSQDKVIDNSLNILLTVPANFPEEKRFDIMMLTLILLINLIEKCEDNKDRLLSSKPIIRNSELQNGLEALVHLFYEQEELAKAEEQKTDAILDGKKDSDQVESSSSNSKSQEEFIEETVAKLLQKAGRHMEHTLIGAYVALLLGHLIMDNEEYENLVRKSLPDNLFVRMIAVLQKFFNFMNLTASNEISSCGIAATEKVIKFLKTADERYLEHNCSI